MKKAKKIKYGYKVKPKFNLINKSTIKHLRRAKKINVPRKKINIQKDLQWNIKMFNSIVMQGIQAGLSVDSIAKGLFPEIIAKMGLQGIADWDIKTLIDRCIDSAIRNARTMTTEAENRGRYDSYRDLAQQGIVQAKIWVATPDDRTRKSHIDIDGEEQDIDKEFSNGLMYPGDPNGDGDEVWNCRCSMRDHIIGFRRKDGSISYVNYQHEETLHDRQMREERERRENNK